MNKLAAVPYRLETLTKSINLSHQRPVKFKVKINVAKTVRITYKVYCTKLSQRRDLKNYLHSIR